MSAAVQVLMIDSDSREDLVTLLGLVRTRLMAVGAAPEPARGERAVFSLADMERLINRMNSVPALRAMEKALEHEIGG